MNIVATIPAKPAVKVYDETTQPNPAGDSPNDCLSCGPSGMMIMKSTMCVNCTAANVSSSGSSRGPGGAAAEAGAAARGAVGSADKGSSGTRKRRQHTGEDSGLRLD